MPDIPTYQPQILPGVHSAQQQGSADVRGSNPFSGLSEVVGEVARHYEVNARRRDRIEADEAIAAVSRQALDLEQGGIKTRMKDSFGIAETTLQAFDDYWSEFSGGLRQRVADGVMPTVTSLRMTMGRKLSAHETAQTQAYEESTFSAFIESQKGAYSQVSVGEDGPDPMEEGFIVGRAEERIRAFVRDQGGDAQMADTAVAKWKADAAMSRLEALVAGREYETARQFAGERLDWIRAGGGDVEAARKLVSLAEQESEARRVADMQGSTKERLDAAEAIKDTATRTRAIQLIRQEEQNRKLVLESRDMETSESLRQVMEHVRAGGEPPTLTPRQYSYLGPERARKMEEQMAWEASGGIGFYSRETRRKYEQARTMLADPEGRMKLARMDYRAFDELYLEGLPEKHRTLLLNDWWSLREAVGREGAEQEALKLVRPMLKTANDSFRKAIGAPLSGELGDDQANEVALMLEELDDEVEGYFRQHGKNPPTEVRRAMISDIAMGRVVDSDWVNKNVKAEDLTDAEDAFLDEEMRTSSEVNVLSPRIRRYARANGKTLSDDELLRILGLRRAMAARRTDPNVRRDAAHLAAEILGDDYGNVADKQAILELFDIL